MAYEATLPAGNSAPVLLSTLFTPNTTVKSSIVSYKVSAPADWYYGRTLNTGATDLAAPFFTQGAYEEYKPPVRSWQSIENTYVMAATGGASTTATVTVYWGDKEDFS
jgi:hypothetical protein